MTTPPYLRKDASLSPDGRFRYRLVRIWSDELPILGWVMLNPSIADALVDDATIRRCVGFADLWGFGGIAVCNVYAYRATDPAALKATARRLVDVRGIVNDDHLHWLARTCPTIVLGWGDKVLTNQEVRHTLRQLEGCPNLVYLRKTKSGQPSHPLRIPYVEAPKPWKVEQPHAP